MELFWFVQITVFATFHEDDGRKRTNQRFQYIEAFNLRDAERICEAMPETETISGGVEYRRTTEPVARVYAGNGKPVYLTQRELESIAEAYTNPGNAKMAV